MYLFVVDDATGETFTESKGIFSEYQQQFKNSNINMSITRCFKV